MSAIKMNAFLQRMLRKSDEELNVDQDIEKGQRVETGKPGYPKGSWIRRLGSYSPSKYKLPKSPTKSATMKSFESSGLFDTIHTVTPKRCQEKPREPGEMPDLESIIREFEMGFLSPTKHESSSDASGQKNYVKKIVAAFEVKYNAYNDQKQEQEARRSDENLERQSYSDAKIYCSTFAESPRGRSRIFASPFKFVDDYRVSGKRLDDRSNSQGNVEEWNKGSGICSTPPNSGKRRSGIFSTPFKDTPDFPEEDKRTPEIYASPVLHDPGESGITSPDASSILKLDEVTPRSRALNVFLSPLKASSLDDTQNIDCIDFDSSLSLPVPEETILLESDEFEQTTYDFSEKGINREVSAVPFNPDRKPKIVGAFLKKPIEVEETSIDWIPMMGKKLPRKRSLKKLLSTLKRKKPFEKKCKTLFSSEKNLTEDSKELQDSGYDEKSCSSSSLTSLISISEVLLKQENSYVEPERRSTLKTFRSKSSLDEDEDEDEAFYDTCSNARKERKLLLTEVPRKDLKLDLGPSYPTPSFIPKIATMSLDRRTSCKSKIRTQSPRSGSISKIPKHPHPSSAIPKHPYVSMTKMDNLEQLPETPEIESRSVKNDLYEVEFRRSSSGFQSSNSYRTSSSSGSDYDVPRRYLSKSESGIPDVCKSTDGRRRNEPVYDVPRSRILERPRSSVYEDALSLRRRNGNLTLPAAPDFYAFANDEEPHYATVKPRNRRICFSEDMIKSTSDLCRIEKNHSF